MGLLEGRTMADDETFVQYARTSVTLIVQQAPQVLSDMEDVLAVMSLAIDEYDVDVAKLSEKVRDVALRCLATMKATSKKERKIAEKCFDAVHIEERMDAIEAKARKINLSIESIMPAEDNQIADSSSSGDESVSSGGDLVARSGKSSRESSSNVFSRTLSRAFSGKSVVSDLP